MVERPPSIFRIFSLCSAMKWSVLPLAGGLYDQNPNFIDQLQIMFEVQSEVRQEQQNKQAAQAKRK